MENTMDVIMAIGESLVSYTSPILILGNSNGMEEIATVSIDARCPKEDLIIFNNRVPKWLEELNNKEGNILYIDNFDKLSLEDQKLFIDLIVYSTISSVKLPNLKILIHAEKSFTIIPELRQEIQVYEM